MNYIHRIFFFPRDAWVCAFTRTTADVGALQHINNNVDVIFTDFLSLLMGINYDLAMTEPTEDLNPRSRTLQQAQPISGQ